MDEFDSKKLFRAISLFIFLDLSVLAINFWIADEMAHDAVSINLAGRQRMLSQRITKTLLQLHQEDSAVSRRAAEQELREAVVMFDRTLAGFESGGRVVGGDGRLVELRRVDSGPAAELVNHARQVWQPIRESILPFAERRETIPQDAIESAGKQMLQDNIQLLGLMNRLASSLESDSVGRSDMLRGVQTVVFILALLNFVIIVRRLHMQAGNAVRLGQHFAALATRDPLTGLFNRREFNDALDRESASARRRKGGMALLLIDLDGFKLVNDAKGHEAGDKVLCAVALRVSEVARANDTVARIGGDEFVLVCPDIADADSAAPLSQRLIDAINQPIAIGGGQVQVGASIGIAFFDSTKFDGGDELIRQADQAMYAAKQAGRNRYEFASYN